ncbi:MAG: hypothetical protein KBD83_09315, partial [Gammaproteobacteria bacterium]|nr:hypothetical protein [Gammaproteobacteria bacterium]
KNEAFDEKYTALNLTFSRETSGTYFVLPSYCDFSGNETQYCEKDASNTKHIADLYSKHAVITSMCVTVTVLAFIENIILPCNFQRPRAVTFASAAQRLPNAVMLWLPMILYTGGIAALLSMGKYGVPALNYSPCRLSC